MSRNPDDLLVGAPSIAEFLFGDCEGYQRVRHLASAKTAAANRLPTFKELGLICARKSAIRSWIEDQANVELRMLAERPVRMILLGIRGRAHNHLLEKGLADLHPKDDRYLTLTAAGQLAAAKIVGEA